MSGDSPATFRGRLAAVSLLAFCAALTACGSASHSGSGALGASSIAHLKEIAIRRSPLGHAMARPVAPGAADFVIAVGVDRTALPVEVRFALRKRPEVGKPVELDVQVTPTAPLGRILTSFHADDGLTIEGGGATGETDRPEPGVAVSHALTIVAQHDGLFYVKATVLVDIGADSVARTFTIPVIAGGGAS